MSRPPKPRLEVTDLSTELDRRELWETIRERLRLGILSGEIPAGANLIERDLADRFDVSRGPIRDALRELAREGLAVDLPRRGTVVATLGFADIREVYAVREGLESVAARLAVERASADDLAGLAAPLADLEAAWEHRTDYAQSLQADLAFHRGLVGLAGNGRLEALFEQMLSQTQLLVRTAAQANPRLPLAMRRAAHRDILRALQKRDVAAAGRAITEHYRYAESRLFSGVRTRPLPGSEEARPVGRPPSGRVAATEGEADVADVTPVRGPPGRP